MLTERIKKTSGNKALSNQLYRACMLNHSCLLNWFELLLYNKSAFSNIPKSAVYREPEIIPIMSTLNY